MATDYTSPATGILHKESAVGTITRSCTYDASEVAVDVSATGALELISIPAGAFVNWVKIEVLVAEVDGSNTVVLDVGDGTDADGWIDGADAETAGTSVVSTTRAYTLTDGTPNTLAISPAYCDGKIYTSADTIDVTPSHDLALCKFTVTVNYAV